MGSTDSSGLGTITFSNYGVTFTQPPIVVCTPINSIYNVSMILDAAPTTSGFKVWSRYDNSGGFATNFHWIAIGY